MHSVSLLYASSGEQSILQVGFHDVVACSDSEQLQFQDFRDYLGWHQRVLKNNFLTSVLRDFFLFLKLFQTSYTVEGCLEGHYIYI